jgi:hypothetical protein
MDNILKKKERERRKEIPVWFEVNLRKPNSKTYAELDFTSLCEDKDVCSCFLKYYLLMGLI